MSNVNPLTMSTLLLRASISAMMVRLPALNNMIMEVRIVSEMERRVA